MAEPRFDRWEMRQKLSAPHTKSQAQQSENRNSHDAHSARAQCDPHDQRQRYRDSDGENAPRTLRKGLHNDQCKHGQQNNHDCQYTDESEQSDAASDLFLHHLTECFAAAPDRSKQDNHVMHTASERRADQDPECAWEEPKLCRQNGTNQRTRTSDCRKMMPENHPSIRRDVILAIVLKDSRRSPLFV